MSKGPVSGDNPAPWSQGTVLGYCLCSDLRRKLVQRSPTPDNGVEVNDCWAQEIRKPYPQKNIWFSDCNCLRCRIRKMGANGGKPNFGGASTELATSLLWGPNLERMASALGKCLVSYGHRGVVVTHTRQHGGIKRRQHIRENIHRGAGHDRGKSIRQSQKKGWSGGRHT